MMAMVALADLEYIWSKIVLSKMSREERIAGNGNKKKNRCAAKKLIWSALGKNPTVASTVFGYVIDGNGDGTVLGDELAEDATHSLGWFRR